MSDFDLFPDSEYLAVQILKAAVSAGQFASHTPRIGTRIPASPDFSKGVLTVQRIGGVPTQRRRLDHPCIQVDVWHDVKKDAHNIAQLARVALFKGEGKVYTKPPAFVTGVEDAQGVQWLFDSINLKPRYTFRIYLSVHNV
jgi:hypothetical protein